MIKLSKKGRRVLRRIYSGLGATAFSFLFPSCFPVFPVVITCEYGMPPYYMEDLLIKGQVKSKKTGEPIPGIGIWIKDITNLYSYFTDSDGSFYIYVQKQDNYTVVFTDIDSGENGGSFKQHTVNLTMKECEALAESPLIIELEEIDG